MSAFLKAKYKAAQTPDPRSVPTPEDAFQTLMQATSGGVPIPSFAEFEAGMSSFHEHEGLLKTLEPAVSLGGPGNPFANTGPLSLAAAKGSSMEEDVGVALTFLGCGVEGTTAEEIEAVWALLDMQGGTRGELKGYLRLKAR